MKNEAEFQQQLRAVLALHQSGDLAGAIRGYKRLLGNQGEQPDLLHMLGLALSQSGAAEEALPWFDRALADSADPAPVLNNQSFTHLKLGDFEAARRSARLSLKHDKRRAGAWLNLGLAETALGDAEEARRAFFNAARLDPRNSRACLESINASLAMGRVEDAMTVAARAGRLHPERDPELYVQALDRADARGAADLADRLYRAGRGAQPEIPGLAPTWGRILLHRYRVVAALEHVESHLIRGRAHRDLYLQQSLALQMLGETQAALQAYRKLEDRFPDWPQAHSNHLIAMQYDPRASSADIFAAHKLWARRHGPVESSPEASGLAGGKKRRIGWISPKFCSGPVASFFRGVAAELPRGGHEHIFYHDGLVNDAYTQAFRDTSDEWHVTRALGDDEFAQQLRQDRLDVVVEMAGHGPRNRLLALASRPVPLQLSWLDYFHSTGTDWIDAVLVDEQLVPEGNENFFTERVWRLPRGRLCYSPLADSPPAEGTATTKPVLASFNRLAKLNDEVLRLWARILQRLPDATIYCRSHALGEEATRARFLKRAARAGLDPQRLRPAGGIGHRELLEAYREVDVLLDSFPFSGCATTCDALWMGVPVVTLSGDTMASRQSAALLKQLGLTSWVADSPEQYVDAVVALATDAGARRTWRKQLRALVRERLCDARSFAQSLCSEIDRIYDNVVLDRG